MVSDIVLEQLLFLQHVLHGGQISSDIIIDQLIFNLDRQGNSSFECDFSSESTYFTEPELDVFHSGIVCLLSRCFLQFQTLVRRFLDEKLPLFDDLLQTIVHGGFQTSAFAWIDQTCCRISISMLTSEWSLPLPMPMIDWIRSVFAASSATKAWCFWLLL